MIPLFGPVPGGMELVVIFIIALMLFGIPLTIFGGMFLALRRTNGTSTSQREVGNCERNSKSEDGN